MDDYLDPVGRSLWGLSFAEPSLNERSPKSSFGASNPYALLEDPIPDTGTDQSEEAQQAIPASSQASPKLTAPEDEDTSPLNSRLGREEFRLLKFQTGQDDSKLSCTTSCESLNAPPAYIALSYSWGFIDVSHCIEVDGSEVLVLASVYSALQSLRKQFVFEVCGGNVWIDAVSINQQDTEEKTQQVQMMSMIYQKATFVVGWLGEMTASNRRGLDVIKRVNPLIGVTEVYDESLNNRIERPAVPNTFTLAEKLGVPYIGHPSWEDVVTIFQKGWFGRVWVIQELLYAQNFMFLCGDTLIEEDLLHFAASLGRIPFLTQAVREARGSGTGSNFATALATWRGEWTKGIRNNMFACLLRTMPAEATDPRDKIFAMTSLCNDVGPEIIDYSKDPQKVLLAYALHQFKASMPKVEALLSSPQTFARGEGIPSWVTCWFGAEPTGCVGLGLLEFSALKQKLAMPRTMKMGIAFVGDCLTFAIHSQKMDTIVAVLDPRVSTDGIPTTEGLQRNIFDDKYYPWFVGFWNREHQRLDLRRELDDLAEGLGSYPTGEAIEEVFWRSKEFDGRRLIPADEVQRRRTLFRGKLQNDVASILSTAAHLRELHQSGHFTMSPECLKVGMQYERMVRDYQLCAAELGEVGIHGGIPLSRNFVITEKGYVAWVPLDVVVGDELHLIDGARVPFVLKRLDTDEYGTLDAVQLTGDPVQLVGDAYVHGLMTGVEIYQSDVLEAKTMVNIY